MNMTVHEKNSPDFKKCCFALIIVTLMGLAPVHWFSPGFIMSNVDLRLPPDIGEWKQYLYMWNAEMGAGAESLFDMNLLIFQAIPALLRLVGLPMWGTQMLSFTFWFILAAFGMYKMIRILFPKASPLGAPIAATSFYLFNLWQEHIWLAFKPPLVAAYAILPWLLTFIISGAEECEKKSGLLIKIALAGIMIAPIGNNISECMAAGLPLLFVGIFILIKHRKKNPRKITVFIIQVFALLLIVNAYWIIPQTIETTQALVKQGYSSSQDIFSGWLEGTSRHTSFSNTIRFQGDWTWYDGHGEPYRPYAELYKNQFLLILLGWVIPIIAFGGFISIRFNYRWFFAILSIVGIWLGMGTHSPLGGIYEWMFSHVPYFWIFRSPYYKFLLLPCLGFAVFCGAFAYWIETKFRMKQWIHGVVVMIIVVVNMGYAYPVTTGKMFLKKEERKFLSPNKIRIPSYVIESGKWLDDTPGSDRVFALNGNDEQSFWTTNWGLSSLAPSLIHFTSTPIMFRYRPEYKLYTQGAVSEELQLVETILKGIYEERFPRAYRLLNLLGADRILMDTSLKYYDLNDTSSTLAEKLQGMAGIDEERSFGNYHFYSVQKEIPSVYTSPDAFLLKGPPGSVAQASQGIWVSVKSFLFCFSRLYSQ